MRAFLRDMAQPVATEQVRTILLDEAMLRSRSQLGLESAVEDKPMAVPSTQVNEVLVPSPEVNNQKKARYEYLE